MLKYKLSYSVTNEGKMESKDKNLHKGHRQRLRKEFFDSDITNMPEHKILEVMLSFVQPQKDVNPLAHSLIEEFGSIANVVDAPLSSLVKVKGVGEVLAQYLKFCSKFSTIYNMSKNKNNLKLTTTNEIVNYLKNTILIGNSEDFYYICLDAKSKVICCKKMGVGSNFQLQLNYRNLLKEILNFEPSSLVICHTHPHGKAYPSQADKEFTFNLEKLMNSIHLRLCDHIILSHEDYFSFFHNKLLDNRLAKNQLKHLNDDLFTFDIGFKD